MKYKQNIRNRSKSRVNKFWTKFYTFFKRHIKRITFFRTRHAHRRNLNQFFIVTSVLMIFNLLTDNSIGELLFSPLDSSVDKNMENPDLRSNSLSREEIENRLKVIELMKHRQKQQQFNENNNFKIEKVHSARAFIQEKKNEDGGDDDEINKNAQNVKNIHRATSKMETTSKILGEPRGISSLLKEKRFLKQISEVKPDEKVSSTVMNQQIEIDSWEEESTADDEEAKDEEFDELENKDESEIEDEIEKVEEAISSNILEQRKSPTNNLTSQVNFKNSTVIIEVSTVNQTLISEGLNLMNLTEAMEQNIVSDESNNNESLHNDSLLDYHSE